MMSRYLRDYGELLFTFHLLSTRTETVRLSISLRRAQSVQWCMSHATPPESPTRRLPLFAVIRFIASIA